ncbi:MAG: DUF547 domain-containing protein [Lentisphaeria bacterium]|nr:DUF547 domain-containing protein [Lentisphaeria bacterium]
MIKIVLYYLFIFSLQASNHDRWTELLHKHVQGGVVDYSGFEKDQQLLNQYLNQIATEDESKLTLDQRMALYINAYNAYTVQLILDHWPISSIKDIPCSKRWKWKGWKVAGKKMSLDDIEHKVLRKMKDPRVHFAIVCASLSCPDLQPKAFESSTLHQQLDLATNQFLSNPLKGMVVKQEKGLFGFGKKRDVLYLSKIFDWFKKDFLLHNKNIQLFISDVTDDKSFGELSIKYLDYNWQLNDKKLK